MPRLPVPGADDDAWGTLLNAYLTAHDGVPVADPTGTLATDTAAIHTARDAAGVGGVIKFQPGTYVINNVQANVVGQRWILHPKTILRLPNASSTHGVAATVDDVTIEGGSFDGNKANNTSINTPFGLRIGGNTDRIKVRDVTFVDFKSHCIKGPATTSVQPASNIDIAGCRFENFGNHAVFLNSNCPRAAIRDCEFDTSDDTANAIWAGIAGGGDPATTGCPWLRITGNHFIELGDMAMELWGGCDHSVISHNRIEQTSPLAAQGSDMCISLDDSDYVTVMNNALIFSDAAQQKVGVEVIRSDFVSVVGNIIRRANVGVSLDGCASVAVVGNTIDGTREHATGSNPGIAIYLHVNTSKSPPRAPEWVTISGNTISNGVVDSWGIWAQTDDGNSLRPNYVTVTGNVFRDNLGSDIKIEKGRYWTVADNVFYRTVSTHKWLNVTTFDGTGNRLTVTGNTVIGPSVTDDFSAGSSDVVADNNIRVAG